MPAARTSKRTKSKKAATAAVVPAAPEPKIPEPEQQAEEEKVTGAAAIVVEVVEAAEKFVEKMDGIEDSGSGESGTPMEGQEEEGVAETGKDGETESSASAPKLTMEERRAKLELLRKKAVRVFLLFLV